MTVVEFERFVERWSLEHPVTMEDLAHIKGELDKIKAAGTFSEVVIYGNRVAVTVGSPVHAETRWIEVAGAPPQAKGPAAILNARAR